MMKVILILMIVISGVIMAQDSNKGVKTVDKVELNKYLGKWYEVARMPNKFQDQCTGGVTAEYSLNEDGSIKVINSCDTYEERDSAEGKAKIVDKKSNAKLEVSFFSILGIRPFWGDYWILGLGEDYEYSVVGTPDREYGWILSRTPKLSSEKMNAANEVLKKNGYDLSRFRRTEQP